MRRLASGLIGREQELDAIVRAVTTRERLAGTWVISGEPGIGKSSVWRAALERIGADGMRVASCRPAGSEVRLSYSALGDLLAPALDRVLPQLPPPQRRALGVALLQADDAGRALDQRAVLAGTLSSIRALAAEGPLCLAVDDAQWLDAPSAEALAYTARRLRSEPVALLLAVRTGPLGVASVPLQRAMPDERVELVPLDGMTLGALHRLIAERLDRTLSRPVLRRVHRTSGGNPFYALELAAALEGAGAASPGEPMPLTGSLQDLLAERLERLPPRTREALLVAAAAPRPTLALLGKVLGASLERRLAPAEAAGVVTVRDGAVNFSHPLLASAAYGAPGVAQRRWHDRLAEHTTDVEDAARHRSLAVDGPDERVAALLMDAARHAWARGAPGVAAELYQAAILRTAEDAPQRPGRIIEGADAMLLVGERQATRDLLTWAVGVLEPGPLRADALRILADVEGEEDAAVAHARELLRQSLHEAGDDAGRQAAVLLDLEMLDRSEDRLADALEVARQALAAAERSGDQRLLTHALTRTADLEVLLGIGGDPIGRFARARELDRETRIDPAGGPTAMLAVCLIRAGRLDEARPLLDETLERAVAEGDEVSHIQLCLFRAELEWLAGDWDASLAAGMEGIELAAQTGMTLRRASLGVPLALVEGGRGAVEAALQQAESAMRDCEALGDLAYARYNREAAGSLRLASGDAAGAAPLLIGYSVERGVEGTKRISFIGDAVEALIATGRTDEAAELIDHLERRADELRRPPLRAMADRGRAILVAEAGDPEAAERLLADAIAAFSTAGMPLERARCQLVLGVVRRRARQKRRAREALTEAEAAFARIGAVTWVERARREIARIGGRTATRGLTPTELRVAELVAEGRSNKEVATELFVSVRAVEANLSRIYEKLGVTSRTELARRF